MTPNAYPTKFHNKRLPFQNQCQHDLQGFKPVMEKIDRKNSDKSETLKICKLNIWN